MLENAIRPYDARRKLAILKDTQEAVRFAADHFTKLCHYAIADHGYFYVALSGGSTPNALFKLLSTSPYKERIDWSHIHFFWGDERNVPPDHQDSNYYMALHSGLGTLPIPKEHIHRMEGEKDLEESAKSYEKTIRKIVPHETFDLIMLGMGEDGHTASLFPFTQALHEPSRLVVPNFIPQKNTHRLTLTLNIINKAWTIVFYVLGSSKQTMLKTVLTAGIDLEKYPATAVGTPQHPALWVLDHAAAALLEKSS